MGSGKHLRVAIKGCGVACMLVVQPDVMHFGIVPTYQWADQLLQLSNNCTQLPVQLSVAASGPYFCSLPSQLELPPGGSGELVLRYRPKVGEAPQTRAGFCWRSAGLLHCAYGGATCTVLCTSPLHARLCTAKQSRMPGMLHPFASMMHSPKALSVEQNDSYSTDILHVQALGHHQAAMCVQVVSQRSPGRVLFEAVVQVQGSSLSLGPKQPLPGGTTATPETFTLPRCGSIPGKAAAQ